jgi:hypothetical protein
MAQVMGLVRSVGGVAGMVAALGIPRSADEEDEP